MAIYGCIKVWTGRNKNSSLQENREIANDENAERNLKELKAEQAGKNLQINRGTVKKALDQRAYILNHVDPRRYQIQNRKEVEKVLNDYWLP